MSLYTHFRLLSLAVITVLLLAGLTQLRTLPAAAASSSIAGTATPVAPTTPEPPAMVARANANIRSGPGTTYPVIGSMRAGQRLPVTGQAGGWWQVKLDNRAGWVWGGLVTANALARKAPTVAGGRPATKPAAPSVAPTLHPAALPDLVVLGPDTQYPVRAQVVRGWDYEFVDRSRQYDIVVRRDVFGLLAHQIDDENVQRYRRPGRFTQFGPLRITLVDAQPHPDARCPGWGWAPDRDTAVDPYGLNEDLCRVEHSLFPQGDGAGTTLLIGWGYNAGTTLAIGGAGPGLGDATTSFFAEALPWPAAIGPADRPDFSQPLYASLGVSHKVDGRWVWQDAFVEIVPAQP